ncbi:MAG: phosphate ABC transporter substrate-binding protein PstS [Acidobacteriaceae bacterium]|jgi:phosphate ABC transporter phosphate-binding protein
MLSGQESIQSLVNAQPLPHCREVASPAGLLRWLLLLLACFLLPPNPAFAQSAQPQTLRSIHTVYVAPISDGTADALRARLIARLKKSPSIRIVDDPKSADAILHSDAVIWPTGTVSLNPRSNSVALRNYQGYLSAELSDAADHPLWSYLVTPSRFRTASIVDDLADQLSSRLLAAIATGIPGNALQPRTNPATAVTLHAAGATFPAPLYQLWFRSFQQDAGGVPITYDAIGSVAGVAELAAAKIDMAASDIPAQRDAAPPEMNVLHIPTVVGGVVVVYNVPGEAGDLNLTPQLLVDIFSGNISRWDDPRIRQWNKSAYLPDAPISVVHRSDGSGTTFVFTSFLAEASPDWKTRVGASIDWPIGVGANGNEGVAQQVEKTPNSIAYVEFTYAIQHHMTYAAVRNSAGRFIHADLASIAAAVATHTHTGEDDLRYSVLNTAAKDAYPITTFTWLLVPKSIPDPAKRAAITAFLHWMLTTGQKQCASLGYTPLPPEIDREELLALDTLK